MDIRNVKFVLTIEGVNVTLANLRCGSIAIVVQYIIILYNTVDGLTCTYYVVEED